MPDKADMDRAQDFARRYAGKPYVWGGAGPGGADCSGYMSILLNVLNNRTNPYVRLFGTGNLAGVAAGLGLKSGTGGDGDFRLGVMYPNESSSGIGHVAGTLAGLNVEERGGAGALVGGAARGYDAPLFGHRWYLPIGTAAEEWFAMPIGTSELDQIKGAVRQVLSLSPDGELENVFGTVNNNKILSILLDNIRATKAQVSQNLATFMTMAKEGFNVDLTAVQAGIVTAVGEAAAEALADVDVGLSDDDAERLADAFARRAGERLIGQVSPPA